MRRVRNVNLIIDLIEAVQILVREGKTRITWSSMAGIKLELNEFRVNLMIDLIEAAQILVREGKTRITWSSMAGIKLELNEFRVSSLPQL
jgi:hypothetical protein